MMGKEPTPTYEEMKRMWGENCEKEYAMNIRNAKIAELVELLLALGLEQQARLQLLIDRLIDNEEM
ncbi:MAG: hypothetical protein FWH37_05660 [Candidatus Bathyarchaeota archaeon]|nr:hypothetical protein [Candidatus Termiticorpusculum sp.]